jgi:c-di-GMP-binding flagellar brake protein YcgR
VQWLRKPSIRGDVPRNKRSGYRQQLELPAQLHVAGMRMAVHATLVNVSVTGCRFRSWVALERGARVQFDWPHEGPALHLAGEIVTREASREGAAFEYGIAFSDLTPAECDLLAKEINEAQRREALNRSLQAKALDVSPAELNRRQSYRAHAEFPVELIFDDRTVHPVGVTATDIGSGGLRVVLDRELTEREELTVRFRLSGDVLKIFPPGVTEEFVETPFGMRKRTKNHRRPFEEMRLRARVAARLKDWCGRPAYGIAFVEVDAYTREEIARFIHAVQLAQLRERRGRR